MDTPREPKEHRKASARTLKPANYNLIIDYRLGPALGVAARQTPRRQFSVLADVNHPARTGRPTKAGVY